MNVTDDELIKRCQQELPYRTDSFEQILRRYETLVFNACVRYLHNPEEAEEASQDVFLRVFHALPKFRFEASFKSWLYRIVTNVCATKYKRSKSQQTKFPTERDVILEEVAAEAEVGLLPIGGILADALDLMTVEDRHILYLRHIAELSFEDLAASLELKLSAAKMRLYRAEKRLNDAYQISRAGKTLP